MGENAPTQLADYGGAYELRARLNDQDGEPAAARTFRLHSCSAHSSESEASVQVSGKIRQTIFVMQASFSAAYGERLPA